MTLPLQNPVSPRGLHFFSRLIQTRRRFRELANWQPVTGTLAPGQPKVSVMLITYNHERFIAQALDSVLSQKRDFDIEINVMDDASTDRTQDIVREYAARHPDIIHCYFNSTNVGHVATQFNTIRGFSTLRGQYFALLEGDDYWTDPEKLSRQVAFLEGHPDFVACAHYTRKVFDDGSRPPEHFLPFKAFGRQEANSHDLITMAAVYHLSSVVYRNVFGLNPPLCLADPASCEVTIHMVYGQFGKFHCFKEYWSAYRVHGQGVFSRESQESHWLFHLKGFRRFPWYLGPRTWPSFAIAVRGFSRYILVARARGVVSELAPSTYVIALLHFIPAAFAALLFKIGRIVKRLFQGNHPFKGVAMELYGGLVGLMPDSMIHAYLTWENRYPAVQHRRRKLKSVFNPNPPTNPTK